jgi:hypothetical protein
MGLDGFDAAVTPDGHELDAAAGAEVILRVLVDQTSVQEDVLTAVVRLNEPVPLPRIKTNNGSHCHSHHPFHTQPQMKAPHRVEQTLPGQRRKAE